MEIVPYIMPGGKPGAVLKSIHDILAFTELTWNYNYDEI